MLGSSDTYRPVNAMNVLTGRRVTRRAVATRPRVTSHEDRSQLYDSGRQKGLHVVKIAFGSSVRCSIPSDFKMHSVRPCRNMLASLIQFS